MKQWLNKRPLLILLMGVGALSMMVPAAHATVVRDFATARAFFYSFLLFGVLTLLIGLATTGQKPRNGVRGQLVGLLIALSVLPLMLAVPFYEAVPGVSFLDAWFEMVSDLTTTGATLFDSPRELPRSVHLWRALVGWLGGLLAWITALAVLAPLNLGGFEVLSAVQSHGDERQVHFHGRISPNERLARYVMRFVPLYTGLTLLLWIGLSIAGELPFVALCHAMSVLATSGISPVNGIYYSAAGIVGEIMIVIFFVFALSHRTYSRAPGEDRRAILRDPEIRLGLFLAIVLSSAMFLRHMIVAIEADTPDGFMTALRAAWGGFFTVLSFITTTGFESAHWTIARSWSGLGTPGLMLVGLAIIGGGVATTAGGVKLFRVYALFRHSQRELERLVHPSSVAGGGPEARRVRGQGAQIGWVLVMLYSFSMVTVMVLLALTGVQFETSMVLAVSALSTTGPLAQIAAEAPISFAGVPDMGKVILAAAMVLGRLEALVLIALFNPEFWRR